MMTIDPSILLNVQQPKFEDPMTRYSNFLAMQQAINKQDEYERTLNDQKALNAVYRNAIGAEGGLDETKLLTGLASNNLGAKIPDVRKGLLELKNKQAETTKTEAETTKNQYETVGKALEYARKSLDGVLTPQQASDWIRASYNNPVLASYHTSQGDSLQKDIDAFANVLKAGKFNDWLLAMKLGSEKALQNHYESQNLGGTMRMLQMPAYGSGKATVVPGSEGVVTPDPRAPRTTNVISVDTKGETAGAVEFGKLEATQLHELKKVALSAPQIARDADRALDILENDKAYTGAFANQQLGIMATFKAMGIPVEGVEGSQELASLLAKKTLSAIQTSGIGARGMDTPKEREFLEKAENGQLTLDRETLLRAARLMRKAANFAIQNYNENAQYAPESWFKGTGARRTLPLLPERKSSKVPSKPVSAGQTGWVLNGKMLKVGDVMNGHRYKGGDPTNNSSWENAR